MASKRFKKVFLIRFTSYLSLLIALTAILFEFGPVISTEIAYRRDQILGVEHTIDETTLIEGSIASTSESSPPSQNSSEGGFGQLLSVSSKTITPVSTDYGIVIEKINANALIVPDVDPGNEAEYTKALGRGIAEARGSTKPGEPGNLFLFSHSTDAPWNIARYNAIFYLLRELEPGDRVVVFYQGRRFDYIVYDKQVTHPKDIGFLTNRYDQPVLTLQTCDPPGTSINRLIVRAKLLGR